MSKIIDALEKARTVNREPRDRRGGMTSAREVRTSHSASANEELADIYFGGSAKTKQPPTPTLIRVSDNKRNFLIPWIITLIFLLLAVGALFINRRIVFDVKILEESPADPAASESALLDSDENLLSKQKDPAGTIAVSSKNLLFSDGAITNSVKNDEAIILSGDTSRRLVYLYQNYKPVFRASDYVLTFEAKGRTGGEMLEVVFKDKDHKTSLNQGSLRPFPMGLSADWTRGFVMLERSDEFDAARVKQMRIDIGSRRTGNNPNATVFIRNVKWVPKQAWEAQNL